jgi:tight adherence protein C
MDTISSLSLVAFFSATSFGLLISLLLVGRKSRVDVRLAELSGDETARPEMDSLAKFTRQTLPRMGTPLVPRDEVERTKLQTRLIHAGFYSPQALYVFLGVKMCMILAPLGVGLALAMIRVLSLTGGAIFASIFGILGLIAPSFWLDLQKKKRQTQLRRTLPDALDVLVICLEGGLSLPAGLRRVATELRTAHPLLAREMNIAQREIQLGWSSGDALRRLADRFDLEEMRSLASVIAQAEHYGASIVKALRVHAETLRGKRMHYAEEMAQKASIKILFPTLFFIFPGLFIVILGPAVMQLMQMLSKLRR